MKIDVIVKRKLHYEDFFGIYAVDVVNKDKDKIKEFNDYNNISIKGETHELNIGDSYTVEIEKDESSKYKGSYILKNISQKEPITVEEQKRFLSSILTKRQVKNIFEHYNNNENIIELISENKFDYESIKGIGEKTYKKISDKVLYNLKASKALSFFHQFGVSYNTTIKLVQSYGGSELAISRVEENPYILTELDGIGFLRADEIALAMNHDKESSHRIKSCIYYVLNEESFNGHTWIGERQLINKAVSLLDINRELVKATLKEGIDELLNIDGKYALRVIYEAEQSVVRFINKKLNSSNKVFENTEIELFLNNYSKENNIKLTEEQTKFFYNWNENDLSILIGSGGTGKTFLLNILLKMLEGKNKRSSLLAPTGRASRVMSDYTGYTASTIHRRIGLKNALSLPKYYIGEDVILIDETSMCDIPLINMLFTSIMNPNAKILFIGDDFQLPSVGVGNFLNDIINSGIVTLSRLTHSFRQKDNGILEVATNVRNNNKFLNHSDDGKFTFGDDCLFHMVDQKYISSGYSHYYKKALEKYRPEEIIILTPTRKGNLGTVSINKEIQKIANPPSRMKKEKSFGKKDKITFRVGDIVMNEVNMYDVQTVSGDYTSIYNGDIGNIIDIDNDNRLFIVDFEGIHIEVTFINFVRSMSHAWAITKHKAQGGQYPIVISIIDKSAKFQLNANLLYTAFSRAQKYMVVLGQAETVNYAMDKFANMSRRSFVGDLLLHTVTKTEGDI